MKKKAYLDNLYYEVGKQGSNFQVAYTYQDKKGEQKWSKWIEYLKAQEDNKLIEKINNRTLLLSEVVIDLDLMPDETGAHLKKRYEETIKRLKHDGYKFQAYFTGSKGYHIHLFFSKLASKDKNCRERFREILIEKYGGDIQKKIDKCMIALENTAHWKTGKPKELLEEVKGINDLTKIEQEVRKYEEKEEEIRLKAFLQEDRKKYESLGCGFVNNIYYFGTKVFKDGKGFNAIVTSDKKLYVDKRIRFNREIIGEDEIKSQFGLNYKEEFFDESLDNIFSNKAIQKWLFDDCSEITFKSLFEELIELFKRYIYFEDERKYSLLACYRIAGFFMPIWKARARLFFYAEMGSAKSRSSQIMHNTGFNSVSLGDWTLAYIKTIIESTRGEIHIDDFETLPEELKNATIRLVKVGYMKGFKAGKMSDGNHRKPIVNDLFNTTSVNNTEGLDFISYDRCITIRIPKISKKEYDKEPNFEESYWQELRDKLYIIGLKYPHEVKEAFESVKSDKIRGRLFSIFKPEMTIAKLISEKVYNDLEEFWVEETEQRSNVDYESDWEFLAFKKIYKLLSTLSTNSTLSTLSTLSTSNYFTLLDDVVEPIGKKLYGEEDFKKKKRSMSIIIGNSLKRNPIFKKRQVKGKTQYSVSFDEFKSLLDAKGYLKPIKEILDGDEVERVECVDSVAKKTYKDAQIIEEQIIDISEIIKEHDKGQGLSFEAIQELSKWPENDLNKELRRLSKDGVIYEPKPDIWKVLP